MYTMKKQKRILRHRHRSLLILTSGILASSCFIIVTSFVFQPPDEQFYFVDTKYKGVQSRTVRQSTSYIRSIIEYPVTKNKIVNDQIATAIDVATQGFSAVSHEFASSADPSTQNVSYQVMYNNRKYLSIVVKVFQDTHKGRPLLRNMFWTFNMTTGKPVTLSELVGNSPDGLARIMIYLRNSVKQAIKQKGGSISSEYLRQSITPDTVNSFIVLNRNTLEFPFGQGAVSPERVGNISVKLSTSNLQLFLQNSVAKDILDVTPIGSAHKTAETDAEAETEITAQTVLTDSCTSPKRCIALTYDDGPTLHTPELLAALRRHHAKATFFTVGKSVVKFPEITKQIDQDGHTIGNHSYSHYSLPSLSEAKITSEITRTNDAIQKTIGKTPRFVRPPYGAVDSKTYRALRQLESSAILWSVDTRDWADRDSEIVCNRVLANARPGAIVIMHDIHPTDVRATECIIKALKKRSYSFVTIDTLLGDAAQPGKGYYGVD